MGVSFQCDFSCPQNILKMRHIVVFACNLVKQHEKTSIKLMRFWRTSRIFLTTCC
jgi:hypothetical protein